MTRRNETFNVRWLDGSVIKIKNMEVRTVLDLKRRIEIEMGLPVFDQKIIVKGKIVKADNSVLNNLQIQPNEIINLLTIQPHTVHEIKRYFKKMEPIVITKTIKSDNLPEKVHEQPIVKEVKAHKTQIIQDISMKKKSSAVCEVTLLSKKHLHWILAVFFDKYQFFKEKRQQIAADDAYLQFFLTKVTEKNPFLKSLHQQEKNMLREAFIEMDGSTLNPQIELTKAEMSKTVDEQIVQDLVNNDFDRDQAIRAVQIAENNVERALQILINGEDRFIFTISKPREQDEKIFIFRWFTHPQRKELRLRLSLNIQNLYKYVNSVKHRCPDFYAILYRNINYASRVINLPIKIDGIGNLET